MQVIRASPHPDRPAEIVEINDYFDEIGASRMGAVVTREYGGGGGAAEAGERRAHVHAGHERRL